MADIDDNAVRNVPTRYGKTRADLTESMTSIGGGRLPTSMAWKIYRSRCCEKGRHKAKGLSWPWVTCHEVSNLTRSRLTHAPVFFPYPNDRRFHTRSGWQRFA